MPSYEDDDVRQLSTLLEESSEFPANESATNNNSSRRPTMSNGIMDVTFSVDDKNEDASIFLPPPSPAPPGKNSVTENRKSPHPRLSEQFSKGHEALDAAKAAVYAEKDRVKELTDLLQLAERDTRDCKAVINVLTTQLRETDDEIRLLKNEVIKTSQVAEEASGELGEAKQVAEREERRRVRWEAKAKECMKEVDEAKKALADLEQEKLKKDEENKEMQKEIQELKRQLEEESSQTLKDAVTQLEFVVRENEFKMEEKVQELETSKRNVQVLKDACGVLEDQLKRMEVLLKEKEECIQNALTEKMALVERIKAHEEIARVVKMEASENKIQLKCLEKQLESYQATVQQEISYKDETIANLKEAMDEMKDFYEDKLNAKDSLDDQVAALKEEMQVLECINKELKTKEVRYGLEISRYLENIVNIKEQNINLKTDLHEANQKVDFYRQRATELMEQKNIADIEKMQQENELQGTINQQAKLVQFFQNQAQQLSAKKKKFRFFGKDKPVELPQPPVDLTPQTKKKYFPDVSYIPRTPSSTTKTPSRVMIEPKNIPKLQFDDEEFSSTEEEKRPFDNDLSSCATDASDSFTNRP